jgi:hypothetical protein
MLLDLLIAVVQAWIWAGVDREAIPAYDSRELTFKEQHRVFARSHNRFNGKRSLQVIVGPVDKEQNQLIGLSIKPPTKLSEVQDRDLDGPTDHQLGYVCLPASLADRLMIELAALVACPTPSRVFSDSLVWSFEPKRQP